LSNFLLTLIRSVPVVLQLVAGLFGLIVSVQARSRGGSGVTVAGFAVMLVSTAADIIWQFVLAGAGSWESSVDDLQTLFTTVGMTLETVALLSWVLVAIGIFKSGRRPQQPAYGPGYPAGYGAPQPGYPQPGYGTPPAGYSQPGYPPAPPAAPETPPTAPPTAPPQG